MATNLQLVEQPEKPERCAAENLKPGQFLAAGVLTTGRPTEVLFVDTYPSDGGGRETLLVHRPLGVDWSLSTTTGGNHWFDLATERELAEFRAGAERAKKIEDLRQAVDFLDERPWLPLPDVHIHVHLQDDVVGNYRTVRELAEREGVEPDTSLDDRTVLNLRTGALYYTAIAWHQDGRPAEPKPLTISDETIEQAGRMGYWNEAEQRWDDPTGLAYSRTDDEPDDPAPVSPARVPMHTGAVTEQGLVDETRAGLIHMAYADGGTVCEANGALSFLWSDVTCPDCKATA